MRSLTIGVELSGGVEAVDGLVQSAAEPGGLGKVPVVADNIPHILAYVPISGQKFPHQKNKLRFRSDRMQEIYNVHLTTAWGSSQ